MKLLLLYPPRGYVFMPYLASPLLKGYIESESNHKVDQKDINLDYYKFLWSSRSQRIIQDSLENCSKDVEATYYHTLSNYLEKQVETSYRALRDHGTYKSKVAVNFHNHILNSVDKLVEFVDCLNEVNVVQQPKKYGEMDEILNNFRKSFLGKWLVKKINDYKFQDYNIIGLSITYSEQFIPSLFIAKLIREYYPSIKIVIGGNMTTHFKSEILNDKSIWKLVDYCIFYEGEHPLLELLDALESGSSNKSENIVYFSPHEIVYKENLKAKPKVQTIPNFDGMELYSYPTPSPIIPILTSKGCYWGKCTYCSHYEGYGQGYYSFKNDHVIDTIRTLKSRYGSHYFYFVDEALPPKTIHTIANYLKENNEIIRWFSEARVEKYFSSAESLQALKDSGCVFLIHGIETGNPEISKKMSKGIDLEVTAEHLKNCKKVGIGTSGMFFVGFPGETYEQAEDTFKFIEKNSDYLDFATVGVFTLERGTPIYLAPDMFGIEKIIDADKAYQDSPDYKLKGENEISTYKSRYGRLKDLHSKYRHLDSKFTNAVNRALIIFLKENEQFSKDANYDLSKESIDIPVIIRHGLYKGKKGLLNPYKQRLNIIK